jgi:hypothetical protein
MADTFLETSPMVFLLVKSVMATCLGPKKAPHPRKPERRGLARKAPAHATAGV